MVADGIDGDGGRVVADADGGALDGVGGAVDDGDVVVARVGDVDEVGDRIYADGHGSGIGGSDGGGE